MSGLAKVTKRKNRALLKVLARARMTYQEAANQAGIDRTTVVRAVNGGSIRYKTAVQLCDVFGVTPEELGLV